MHPANGNEQHTLAKRLAEAQYHQVPVEKPPLWVFNRANQAFAEGRSPRPPRNWRVIIGLIAAITIGLGMIPLLWSNPVLYSPKNLSLQPLLASIGFSIVAVLIVLIGIVSSIVFIRRSLRYAAQGRVIDGELVEAHQWKRGSGNRGGTATVLGVIYQFVSPDSGQIVRKLDEREVSKKNTIPLNGAPVKVLYVNDKLYRLL